VAYVASILLERMWQNSIFAEFETIAHFDGTVSMTRHNLSYDSWCSGQDSKQSPHDYIRSVTARASLSDITS